MTSRVHEIQKLIADIDNLLNTSGKRLPRLLSNQAPEAKEVLEKIRNFLVQEKESEILNSNHQNQVNTEVRKSPLLDKFVNQGNSQCLEQQNQPEQEQGNLLIQQLKSELSSLIGPLQAELATMSQERENLRQEIRQLEQRKLHNYSLSQQWANQDQMIGEFLQLLISRIASNLTPEMVGGSASDNNPSSIELGSTRILHTSESSEQLQKLTYLTEELDQRLLSLDGTLNFVFEALQRNINTYHESLSQGLARMHSDGVQGEQLMANFVKNLSQHLQQQAQLTVFSFPELEKNQPLSPSTSSSVPTNPTDDMTDQTTQSWEFSLSKASSSLTVNDEQKDVIATDELGSMLLELGVDDSVSPRNIATELEQNDLESIDDEVAQLYASLLSTDNLISLNVDVEDLSSSHITPTTLTSEPEVIPANNIPQIIPTDAMEGVPRVLEPSVHHADVEPQSWQDFPVLSPTEVTSTDNLPVESRNADTITALTQLFTDVEAEEQILEIASHGEVSSVIAYSQQLQHEYLDNYIPAYSQESQCANLQDITLDEGQMQQLNQDLAKFDEIINPDLNLDVFPGFENSINQQPLMDSATANFPDSSVDVFEVNPISSPQTEADLHFSPSTETKDKVTTLETNADKQGSSMVTSNFVNNTDVALNTPESVWYLGIDVGTTGISAALLNRSSAIVYPIYWSAENQQGVTSFQQLFRLPAEVYLPTTSTQDTKAHDGESQQHNFYSVQLKPYLQIAIPYKNEQEKWEPVLQFNHFSAGPLIWVVRSLSKLLLTLKSDPHSTTQGLTASAVGLSQEIFHNIINNITGVICTCPSGWSEQYRFNLREAVLISKLVQHPQQIFFVEEAIASLLSILHGANGETVQIKDSQGLHLTKTRDDALVGHTFVINIGASTTEMTLVDLPKNLQQLAHRDFMLHSFPYGSNAIEQDIICQLLLTRKYGQPRNVNQEDNQTNTNNSWQWQPAFPGLDEMRWESLGLEELDLPQVGEPDIAARIRLQQKLESSVLGQAVLNAALTLKLILQQQDSFTLELADRRWVLQRRDLENYVLIPFVRRLNREFNKLLVARGIPTEAINQAILTGGLASLAVVNSWLRQKLSNSQIIQYLYLGENGTPSCSRVAYGLATLPLHPQVLEQSKQRYTDYFLFMKLLQLLPDRTLSFGEILQLFQDAGINTSICQQRLLAFLEGELPPGLIPGAPNSTWLNFGSQNNPDYTAIAGAPLFEKQGNLTYRPKFSQLLVLQRYLNAIKVSSQQPIQEPYTANFESLVIH
ncbi:hypothetical protein [Umezakia ovalisporum]|uniref:Uncharacterized protein n=1 Tax=Umezakia ovalisporum FSS-62 TaxID=2971776 RepID=A0AA43GXC4_9CYAN|nr:hypothetical protein [Umezakia ovalisporum]MDH6063128.1 hypothetical protein [Umezakia ovalisporum FSS-62]MDH6102360.1 hypothetical protein [Umezakia ovalisporum ANA283AFssAo]